jgi:hypothetical protein
MAYENEEEEEDINSETARLKTWELVELVNKAETGRTSLHREEFPVLVEKDGS